MTEIPKESLSDLMSQHTGRVLDVGSGDQPHPFADVLCDTTPKTESFGGRKFGENPTSDIVTKGRPFVRASIEALPFADKSFTFVHCSHVIEHTLDPGKALSELQRVAPRGYLECPRSWFEYVDASPFHRWRIDFHGGKLWFFEKSREETEFGEHRRMFDLSPRLFVQLYGGVLNASGSMLQRRLEKRICHLSLYWEGEIEHEVHRLSG